MTGIAVASVVPRLRTALREMTEKWFKVKTVIVEPGVRTGMPILYDNPKEVGADRIADAVAAFERYGGPDHRGRLRDGHDLRGHLGARASTWAGRSSPASRSPWTRSSAGPPRCPGRAGRAPQRASGKNTVESIQSGAVYGFAAQVDGLCARFEEELGPCTVVATGGLAGLIAPLTRRASTTTSRGSRSHGLRIIYEPQYRAVPAEEPRAMADDPVPLRARRHAPPICGDRFGGLAAGGGDRASR